MAPLLLVMAVGISGCVIFRSPAARIIESTHTQRVTSPLKAHMTDGSVVVFVDGATVTATTIVGRGRRLDLTRTTSTPVTSVSADSVAALEVFYNSINAPATFLVSTLATAGVAVGAAALAVAIFGSCPTVYAYAEDKQQWVLEAESFSFSIAPLFEARDVDLLRAQPDARGVLRLEIRNEAAETHYINHLELLAVEHGLEDEVVPDLLGIPIALRNLTAPVVARDRTGRDVLHAVADRDSTVYATDPTVLETATELDLSDHVDLTFVPPLGSDSVALVLRARNSLLTTVLLYDVMLGDQGAGAVDWLGQDLETIGTALELGQWYRTHLGMRVAVGDGETWRDVAWIRDVGPIAWKRVAVMLPRGTEDSLRVRLSFVADGWRIDRVALGGDPSRPPIRTIAPSAIRDRTGAAVTAPLAATREPDQDYLQTTPGDRFTVEFDVGVSDAPRTLLLAAQGYYVEWIRASWLAGTRDGFEPTPSFILDAIRRWRASRETLEGQFYASKIPVR